MLPSQMRIGTRFLRVERDHLVRLPRLVPTRTGFPLGDCVGAPTAIRAPEIPVAGRGGAGLEQGHPTDG
jgi:hypothetical protein